MANEFSLINKYFKPLGEAIASPNVVLGMGDDCALVAPRQGFQLALSSDTLVSGVHFLETADPADIGYKALAVNLSDLAAMGAEPAWFSLCLSLPEQNEPWLKAFVAGLSDIAQQFSIPLVGGDTTQGPLSISVHIAGWVPEAAAVRRSGANPGDIIYVAGDLGWPSLGLQLLTGKAEGEWLDNTDYTDRARSQLLKPMPQVSLGLVLREYASAMLDISDGLTADLSHILEASQVGAQLDLDKIPYAKPLEEMSQEQRWDAVNFGDEYKLLFTVPKQHQETISSIAERENMQLSAIGTVVERLGIHTLTGSKIETQGYSHF